MTKHTPVEEDDIQLLVAHCKANLDLTHLVHAEEYGYTSLPLCIIDCIFSIGVRYEAVRNTVQRFRDYLKISKFGSDEVQNIDDLSIADFIQLYRDNSVEFMTREVYKNRQRTSTENGILKAEAVLRVAEILLRYEVNWLPDIELIAGNPNFEAEFQRIPGQSSGISLRYFYMLTGSVNHIKPDRMIIRFVHTAIGRTVNVDECHQLVLAACRQLVVDYPKLDPRSLDHQMWLFQRK